MQKSYAQCWIYWMKKVLVGERLCRKDMPWAFPVTNALIPTLLVLLSLD